jgi:Uncharacterised nucleotidyltransferase
MTEGLVTRETNEELFAAALEEATSALEMEDIQHVVFGSIAAITYGRPGPIGDIDILVRKGDARRVLKALERIGFDTEETDAAWIFKAWKYGVLIDVIFAVKGGIYLDEEMLAHTHRTLFSGRPVRMVSPEDAVLIEALSTEMQNDSHWWNALGIIARGELDWAYLERRARYGPRRILALLVFAESSDLVVPRTTIRSLFTSIYEA